MIHIRAATTPFFVALLMLSVLVSACGGDDSEADPDGEPAATETITSDDAPTTEAAGDGSAVRYMAIGDSLSQGIGADDIETQAFPARLADRWREAGCSVELNNVAISGYTAGQMLAEQVPQIADFGPTIITFQSGANDIANSETEDAYRENVAAVLDAATSSGATVYVLLQNDWYRAPAGPGYGGTQELRDAYDAIMSEEAQSRGVEILDLRDIYAEQADNDEWVDDGIHPTAGAYDTWSERLAEIIPLSCES